MRLHSKPCNPLIPYSTIPKHMHTTILSKKSSKVYPGLAMNEKAADFLRHYGLKSIQDYPQKIWNCQCMPSFSEFFDINIFGITINIQKQQITRYHKKYGNGTTAKNHRKESTDIFIYCNSRKAHRMQLINIYVMMINMYKHY